MYAFTNQREETVTWCDSQWAQIGFDIARPCQVNGTGGECNGRGFKVEVISNDGSTNTPIPYSSNIPTTSPVSTASANATTSTTTTQVTTVDLAVYTDLFPPSDPTPTNPNLSDDATMGSSKMLPWLVGAIGGFAFVLICIVLCYYMIWRRSQRQNMMRLASEDGHTKPAVSGSYRMQPPKVKQQQQHQFTLASTSSEISSKGKVAAIPSSQYLSPVPHGESGRKNNIQSTTENENENNDNTPTGSRPQTGSRVPTSLSTYTLDPDPFRALKRVISGRRNNAKSPAPAVV
ncbi:hypothetical protein FRB91_000195 [Serendipita sp. 411]|nr:hypothetical protein FRB91_000195 [Serendipita sp. 411]